MYKFVSVLNSITKKRKFVVLLLVDNIVTLEQRDKLKTKSLVEEFVIRTSTVVYFTIIALYRYCI